MSVPKFVMRNSLAFVRRSCVDPQIKPGEKHLCGEANIAVVDLDSYQTHEPSLLDSWRNDSGISLRLKKMYKIV